MDGAYQMQNASIEEMLLREMDQTSGWKSLVQSFLAGSSTTLQLITEDSCIIKLIEISTIYPEHVLWTCLNMI